MKLKDLEKDIALMEQTVKKMESLNRNVQDMDQQVDKVQKDMVQELQSLERQSEPGR